MIAIRFLRDTSQAEAETCYAAGDEIECSAISARRWIRRDAAQEIEAVAPKPKKKTSRKKK